MAQFVIARRAPNEWRKERGPREKKGTKESQSVKTFSNVSEGVRISTLFRDIFWTLLIITLAPIPEPSLTS